MTVPTSITLDLVHVERLLQPALNIRDVLPDYAVILTTTDAPRPTDPEAPGPAWCVLVLPRVQNVRVFAMLVAPEDIERIWADRGLDEVVVVLDADDDVAVRVMPTGAARM